MWKTIHDLTKLRKQSTWGVYVMLVQKSGSWPLPLPGYQPNSDATVRMTVMDEGTQFYWLSFSCVHSGDISKLMGYDDGVEIKLSRTTPRIVLFWCLTYATHLRISQPRWFVCSAIIRHWVESEDEDRDECFLADSWKWCHSSWTKAHKSSWNLHIF